MCEVRLSPTGGGGSADEAPTSPVCGNGAIGEAASCCDLRAPPQYRVLRPSPRDGGRSVDRNCAGRNATSVKGVEPRQTLRSVVAEQVCTRPEYWSREASTSRKAGTTGVQDHSMHRRPVTEHLRSARGRAEAQRPWSKAKGQASRPESKAILRAKVRCLHCSEEAG